MTQEPLIRKPIQLHPALPEQIRRRVAGREICYVLPRSVRMRLRQPERLTVSQCAAKYRQVTGIDARPGPWRNDLVPHAVMPMDLFLQPWIKEIWLCWPERTAKTNVKLNCLAAVAKCAPGNVFWLEPADDDAGNNVKTKIIPMFRQSPGLKKYLSARADDTGKKLIAFSHGMHLFPASANSARTMANFFGKYNFGNEVDKYPALVGTETDPIKLIRKRGRDVRGSKYLFGSTPAGKYIYKGTLACRQLWKYHNRCPHCGELILMDDAHLDIPTGATPDQVENGDVQVGYSCNACAVVWTEHDRELSYKMGKWVCVKGADDPKPRTVGFHASALPFPMIPLAEYAGKYLRAKEGERADKIDYAQGYQVVDYEEEKVGQLKDDHILKFRSELPRNLVPPDTAMLGLKVDPRQDSFDYEVWAFSYAPQIRPHMVAHGNTETFEDIEAILYSTSEDTVWKDHTGKEYRIAAGIIDSGGNRRYGQKHSRTVEVYEWCSRNRIMTCLKGVTGRAGEMITYKTVTTYPGTNKPIPGGLKRVNVRVDIFKDEVERRLAKEPDDTGALSFHSGIDEAFAKHFTGETKDEHGDWNHTKKNQRIDYWDLTVYALVFREMMKLRIPKKPAPSTNDQEQQKPRRPGGFVKGWK